MKEGTGEYKYPAGCHKPEYETLGMFGADCLNADIAGLDELLGFVRPLRRPRPVDESADVARHRIERILVSRAGIGCDIS